MVGIIEDEKNHLWLSTGKGVSKFDLSIQRFINFDTKDGLGSEEFSVAADKLNNGNIVFGGSSGITIFNPDSIYINEFKAPVIINSFKFLIRR